MNCPSKIILFSDVLGGFGGIEILSTRLLDAFRQRAGLFVSVYHSNGPAPFLEELEELGISIYRQPRILGDRWQLRQNLLSSTRSDTDCVPVTGCSVFFNRCRGLFSARSLSAPAWRQICRKLDVCFLNFCRRP